MGRRREGRILAVQFLYQHDAQPKKEFQAALDDFLRLVEPAEGVKDFALPIIKGVLEHRAALDERVQSYCKNWEMSRIALVDRNIMRVALFEMLFQSHVPPVVAIDEAIEIAKFLSTDRSGKFVNGILDGASKDLNRDPRKAQDAC